MRKELLHKLKLLEIINETKSLNDIALAHEKLDQIKIGVSKMQDYADQMRSLVDSGDVVDIDQVKRAETFFDLAEKSKGDFNTKYASTVSMLEAAEKKLIEAGIRKDIISSHIDVANHQQDLTEQRKMERELVPRMKRV